MIFKDYFLILQVHFLASDEVIKAAYRRLCQLYHPDKGGDIKKFQMIQEAYEVLSCETERKSYHKKWLEHYIHDASFDFNELKPSLYDITLFHVKSTLLEYLDKIRKQEFEKAYDLISQRNRDKLFLKDFVLWQKLIAEIHHLLDFDATYESYTHKGFLLSVEYKVKVKEFNKIMNHVEEDFFKRSMIFEDNCWRVLLSDVDTRSIIRKYKKILALKKKNIKKYLPKIDENHMTKHVSKKYFINNCEYERLRFLRYGNPFSLLWIEGNENHDMIELLHHETRALDCYCEYAKHNYLLLLPETDLEKCQIVARKIRSRLNEQLVYHGIEMSDTLSIKELIDDLTGRLLRS